MRRFPYPSVATQPEPRQSVWFGQHTLIVVGYLVRGTLAAALAEAANERVSLQEPRPRRRRLLLLIMRRGAFIAAPSGAAAWPPKRRRTDARRRVSGSHGDTFAETKGLPWKVNPDNVRTDHEIASCQPRIAGVELNRVLRGILRKRRTQIGSSREDQFMKIEIEYCGQ
jgi:hypothetical protein